MSIYRGRTAGLMYGEQLRQREEEKQLQRERIDAGLKQAAMAEQGRIAGAQIAGLNQGIQEERQPAGLPTQPPEGRTAQGRGFSKEHNDLATYIHGVAMGSPLEAEKNFGMARPGSTIKNPDGSISFTSTEGHAVTIPKEYIDSVISGYKPKAPMDELTKEGKKTKIELDRARLGQIGKEKPLNELQQAQLVKYRADVERQHRTDVKKLEDEIFKHKNLLAAQNKIAATFIKEPIDYIRERDTATRIKQNIVRLEGELDNLKKAPSEIVRGQSAGLPTTPLVAPQVEQQPAQQPQNIPVGLPTQSQGYVLGQQGVQWNPQTRTYDKITMTPPQLSEPQTDANANGIADEDEQAMTWATSNKTTNPIKAKAIMDTVKSKYPKIYGEK